MARAGAESLVAGTVIAVRVNTRVDLVGDVGVMRTSVGAGAVGSSMSGATDAVRCSEASASAESLVVSTVITIRVNTRVELVGDVGVMRTSVGASAGAMGISNPGASASDGLMAGTVITIRINTGVSLIGNVGAVRTGVGAATLGGSSGSASQRLGGAVGS